MYSPYRTLYGPGKRKQRTSAASEPAGAERGKGGPASDGVREAGTRSPPERVRPTGTEAANERSE